MLNAYQREQVAELLFKGECFINEDSFEGMQIYLELGNIVKFDYIYRNGKYHCRLK